MDKKFESRYASLLYTVLFKVREIGEGNPGSDEAFACYQILDTALQEAGIYDLTPANLGLEGFDPNTLLQAKRKAA